jgi:ABC-type multidrug transport system fused ATPase/permease subunit
LQTILSGTLREALDPLDKGIPDKAMFDALRAVHLLPSVKDSIESDHLSCFGNLDLRVGQQGKVEGVALAFIVPMLTLWAH